jgi:hypothetical protein
MALHLKFTFYTLTRLATVLRGNIDRPTPKCVINQIPELRHYLLALLDIDVFGEFMPEVLGFNLDGSIRPEAAP